MRVVRLLLLVVLLPLSLFADDQSRVRDAIKRSTLNQAGTKAFHLKATLTPTRATENATERSGEVEIWWVSPTRFRREVRSPQFHQLEIVDGEHRWQKSEGDYYPEWLREAALELIEPVPPLDDVLIGVKGAEVRHIMGQTNYSWMNMSTGENVQKGMGAGLALTDTTGLLLYWSDLGQGGEFGAYQDFHGRKVARKVSVGSPQVSANVTVLEELRDTPAELFNAQAAGADAAPLRTLVVDELSLRKHLQAMEPIQWPAVKDGPLEGVVTSRIVLDRKGAIRELQSVISDNPLVNDAAAEYIRGMKFSPYEVDGAPVQVISRITMPFKTRRPVGVESLPSAQSFFEKGRATNFLSAQEHGAPYALHATFDAKISTGVTTGTYDDTWVSPTQWKREAKIGSSRLVRAQSGEKRYQLAEGPDAGLLKLVFKLVEPIPAIDTFHEADWHLEREQVDGVDTVRVGAGENREYWFNATGGLVKARVNGLDVTPMEVKEMPEHPGVRVPHLFEVRKGGALALRIRVESISAPEKQDVSAVQMKGREYVRQFTDEVR